MLLDLGCINTRRIRYCDLKIEVDKLDFLPLEAWVLVAVADKHQTELIHLLAEKCSDNNVSYVCGVGSASSEISLAFDALIVARKLATTTGNLTQDFADTPVTTEHEDVEEGFWFSVFVAVHELKTIEQVVVINLTTNSLESEIRDLIVRMNAGWSPAD